MSSLGGSFSHTSFHVGSDFLVRCSAYPDQVPILSLDARGIAVSITPSGKDATDEGLAFARALVHEVGVFAAEVERLHAAQHADSSATEGGTAATDTAAAGGTKAAESTAA